MLWLQFQLLTLLNWLSQLFSKVLNIRTMYRQLLHISRIYLLRKVEIVIEQLSVLKLALKKYLYIFKVSVKCMYVDVTIANIS